MRLCTIDDCDRKHLAKGFCNLHYSRQNPNHRRMIDHPCDGCGKVIKKEAARLNRYPTLYCTPKCKTATQHRDLWAIRKAVVIYDPAIAKANKRRPKLKVSAETHGLTFRCVHCAVCTTAFVTLRPDVTCGGTCQQEWEARQRQESGQRRRALQRNAYRAPVRRRDIYSRDDYTCKLCNEPLNMDEKVPHPLAPTIDHVRPLARGGTHEPGNVQAAHFLCNSTKSDRWDTQAA